MTVLYVNILLLIFYVFQPIACQPSVTLTVPPRVSEAEPPIEVCVVLNTVSESGDVSAIVRLQTRDITATSGLDYMSVDTMLTLDSSSDTFRVCTSIPLIQDNLLENPEMFQVFGTATITTTDGTNMVTINPQVITILENSVVTLGFAEQEYTFLEGGSEPEVCVVVLEGEIVRSLPIVVAFIEDIPDTAIEGADYSPISSRRVELTNLTPPSGSCVPIPLINDNLLEEMETFTLSLISRIGDTAISDEFNGTDITIVDDDEVVLSVFPMSVRENDDELVEACVEIGGAPSMGSRNITVTTVDDTATASFPGSTITGDYELIDVVIIFPEGTTELRMCVNVTINEDNSLEPVPEMFTIVATAMNGDIIAGSPQTVTIISEDTVVVGFTREEYNITEGAEQSVCVSILEGEIQSGGPPIALTVSALDGTAQGFPDGGDYSFDNRQVLLSANITTVCFPPGVLDDDLVENTENYRLVLNNSDNVILMGQETTILIQDNDVLVESSTPLLMTTSSIVSTMITSTPIQTPIQTPIPSSTPAPIPIPSSTPVPIPIPSSTPAPIPIPSSTLAPIPIPSSTLAPIPIPSSTPAPIPIPSSTLPIPIPTPTPEPITCPPPPCLDNGSFNVTTPTISGSVAQYQCNEGFRFIQNSPNQLTCGSDGSWSPSQPGECVVIKCPVLPNPPFGCVVQKSRTVGSVARYSCYSYRFTRPDVITTCRFDGTWSRSAPNCRGPPDCPEVNKPLNGYVRYAHERSYYRTAFYYCNPGYKLCGSRTKVCRYGLLDRTPTPSCIARKSYRKQCKDGYSRG